MFHMSLGMWAMPLSCLPTRSQACVCPSPPQHWDYFFDKLNTQNGGNRYSTVLTYLSAAEEGGETVGGVGVGRMCIAWYTCIYVRGDWGDGWEGSLSRWGGGMWTRKAWRDYLVSYPFL